MKSHAWLAEYVENSITSTAFIEYLRRTYEFEIPFIVILDPYGPLSALFKNVGWSKEHYSSKFAC